MTTRIILFMENDPLHYIEGLRDYPALLLLALAIFSFVWADFAVICGAVLASQDYMTAPLFVVFLFMMIFAGDGILYGLGRYAGRLNFVATRTQGEKSQNILALLHRNFFEAVFFSRFVPALRVPTYMLIGALAIPFSKFAKYVAAIIILWSGGLFLIAYVLGNYAFDFIREYKIIAIALIAFLLWLLPRSIAYILKAKNKL